MYCKYCGSLINSNSNFCPSCGASLKEPVIKTKEITTDQAIFAGNSQPGLGLGITGCILGPFGFLLQVIPSHSPFFIVCVVGIILSSVGLNQGIKARKQQISQSYGSIITSSIGLGLSIFMVIFAFLMFVIYSIAFQRIRIY